MEKEEQVYEFRVKDSVANLRWSDKVARVVLFGLTSAIIIAMFVMTAFLAYRSLVDYLGRRMRLDLHMLFVAYVFLFICFIYTLVIHFL